MFIGTTNARSMGNWATRARKMHHYKRQKNLDLLIISEIQGFNTTEYTPLNPDPRAHPWSRQINLQSLWGKHVAIVALCPNIDLEFIESHEDERIIIARATDTKTHQSLWIIGIYISPQFDKSKSQWDTLNCIEIINNTVLAGNFNTWTDKLRDTFPVQNKPHHKGATMLQFMAAKGLIFNLDKDEEGPASLTCWAFDIDDSPIKGSRLGYVLVAGALASITSKSIVITSLVSDHMIVVVKIAKPKKKKQVWSIMPARMQNIEWVRPMEKTLPKIIDALKITEKDIPKRWEKIKEIIKEKTNEYEKHWKASRY
ncbi:hypothetical protein DSO57_1004240 [Entomophthora muscae]|uniref:Uncharacterized protein n=1 Tax=Entomophthora muscae TaxID=34485 RepID=A0ACC2SA35_9FUNG|nr:hypothetical protein DSO57_1004240 [Entomophthora muscae]